MPGELEIISKLRRVRQNSDDVSVGIGDDAAVIHSAGGKDLIACCDLMVESVHFRTDWMPPRLLGRKALAVNLSDVAAMGGIPKFAMISIALPSRFGPDFVDEFFGGLFELAKACDVSIVGGDTSSSPDSLFIDVGVIGECETGKAVTRGGATIGDQIFVTGSLGASALGLLLLEGGFRLGDSTIEREPMRRQAILKHLSPETRLKTGRELAEARLATAMIDISDGLSTDLCHILEESNCGAVIYADKLPVAECVNSIASTVPGIDALRLALHGGEEYELLFTARPESIRRVFEVSTGLDIEITAIGEIVGGKGLQLRRDVVSEQIKPEGFEHKI
jgi:thiamine-monophosphate kinase